jgi:PTS system nitrogen regulatory IIA component
MKMRDLLSIERVIPRLRTRDKQDALRKLAAHAADDVGVSAAGIVRSVLKCADLPAFGPRAGVSLPHAFVPGLRGPIATFARLEPAVDFGAADGTQTDLVALLLSPAESAGNHLRALACMARTLRDPNVRNLLRASQSRDSLYVILCGSEEQQWSRAPTLMEGRQPKRGSGGRKSDKAVDNDDDPGPSPA